MLGQQESEARPELPLDFTQFLSNRLRLEPPATLAMLGTFLLSFEPTGSHPRFGASTPSPHPDNNHLSISR